MRCKWSSLLCSRKKIFVRLLIFLDIASEDSQDRIRTSDIYTLTALWSRLTVQGVPKVRSSNFMHYKFWSKLYFYMKFLENVYLSIKYMYSEFQWLVCPFCFFITFCSRCGMKWDRAFGSILSFFITWCAGCRSIPK